MANVTASKERVINTVLKSLCKEIVADQDVPIGAV